MANHNKCNIYVKEAIGKWSKLGYPRCNWVYFFEFEDQSEAAVTKYQ